MKRILVERFGGPEVLGVVDEDDPRPGPGEVCVRVLAAGVSYTDQLVRAGSYLGGPKPPFTPGYELVGVVEELGSGCEALRPGDRVAALTVWGGYAERVCVPEPHAVPVAADLDPAEVVSLVFPYMTAYQLLHRTARAVSGETVLFHGAAGRVGTAVLELGAPAGLRVYGTASTRSCPQVERLGGVAIDYTREDFLARVRELTGDGVDIALDGLGGYAATGYVGLAGLLSRRRSVLSYRIAKLRDQHPDWFREDLLALVELVRAGMLHPVVAERLPLTDARRAHELLEGSAATGKLVLVP